MQIGNSFHIEFQHCSGGKRQHRYFSTTLVGEHRYVGTTLHRYVKATLPFLQKMLLNKATYDHSFANSSPNFIIFGILVNNDIVDMAHDLGCYGNHFDGKICVTIVTKMGTLLN